VVIYILTKGGTSTPLSQSMIQYYMNNILKKRQSYDYKVQKTEKFSWATKGKTRESIKRGLEELSYRRTTTNLPCFRCAKESSRKGLLHFTLWDLHMQVQGCQKIISEYIKWSQVACTGSYTCTGSKWCGSGMEVQAMASNINGNQRISSNSEIK